LNYYLNLLSNKIFVNSWGGKFDFWKKIDIIFIYNNRRRKERGVKNRKGGFKKE